MMKWKKRTLRILSLLVALVTLMTSIQFSYLFTVQAATGDDIDPYFADTAKIQAYYDSQQNINVSFSSAEARTGYNGQKSIDYYIVAITDLTERDKRETVLYAHKVTGSGEKITDVIKADSIKDFWKSQDRYNVSVTAVDNEGWRSVSLNAIVVNAPLIKPAEDYSPDPNGKVKYVMDMERGDGIGDDYPVSNNVTNSFTVNNVDSNQLSDASTGAGNGGSQAYRFWFNGSGDNNATTAVDFSVNRRAYNFVNGTGATAILPSEVMIWVDFTNVTFDEVDFRIRYNDKKGRSGIGLDSIDQISDAIYSTANYNQQTTLYMTDENGFWVKKTYDGATITDLKNYRGILRIPVECFIDQNGKSLSDTVTRNYKNGWSSVTDNISPLEDVYSFGMSFKAKDAGNAHQAFYIDDIAFYRNDGKDYVNNSNETSAIKSVSEFYDRTTELSKAIANYIMTYISDTPTYADKSIVNEITDMMDLYGISEAQLKTASLDAFNRYKTGKDLVNQLESQTDRQIVEDFECEVGKLPDTGDIDSFTADTQKTYKQLYATYMSFNLAQLRFLSQDVEDKIIEGYNLVYGTKDRVGSALATRPWISFNTFDSSNYHVGMLGSDLYDDYPNAFSNDTLKYDRQHTKGLTHYTSATFASRTVSGSQIIDYYMTGETENLPGYGNDNRFYANGASSAITNNGYNGTDGATLHFNRDLLSISRGILNPFRETATLAFTYNGNTASEWNNVQGLNIANWTDKTIGDTLDERLREMSLAFYLDTTGVTGLDITLKICTGSKTYFLNNGKDENQRYIRTLDSETGQWNTSYLSSTRQFINGKTTDEGGNTIYALDNFKGWVYIPLVYFKEDATGNPLDDNNDLSDIKAIKFCVQHRVEYYKNNDGESFENKDVTVDSFGFTYDPTFYAENAAARDDQTFDEFFEVETTDSRDFILAVNNLDIYSATASADLTALYTQYDKLSDYQKNLTTVKAAKKKLDDAYELSLNPPFAKKSVAQLKDAIDALPSSIKNADLDTDTTKLPYPLNFATAKVDYSKFGTTKEELADVAEYYEQTYLMLSTAQRAELGSDYEDQLKSAYDVYKRTKVLEEYISDYGNLKTEYAKMFTKVDVNGTDVDMASITDLTPTFNFLDTNVTTSIFTKDTAEGASPAMINTAYSLLRNSTSQKLDGKEVDGALVTFVDKTEALTDEVQDLIDARTPISSEKMDEILDIIGEYDSFPDYYKNVTDVYYAVEALKALFPQVYADDFAVPFNSSTTSKTGDIDISYVASLEDVDLYLADNNTFKMKSDDGDEIGFEVTLGDASAAGDKIGTVTNSVAESGNALKAVNQPFAISVKIKDSDVSLLEPKDYTGKINITYASSEGTVVLTIPVTYSDDESYIVSIPADQTIPFGKTENDIGRISVDLNIANDKSLTVSLNNPTGRKMSLTKSGQVVDTLSYDLISNSNAFASKVYTMSNKSDTVPLSVNITDSSWAAAFADEYSDTLTFTVSCS